jgi:hypothetical protein
MGTLSTQKKNYTSIPVPVLLTEQNNYVSDTRQKGENFEIFSYTKALEKCIKIFIYRRPTLYPLEIAVDFLKPL